MTLRRLALWLFVTVEEKRFSPRFSRLPLLLLRLLKIQQTRTLMIIGRCFTGCTAGCRIKRFEKTTVSKPLSHLGQLNNFTFEIDFFAELWENDEREIYLMKVRAWKAFGASLMRFLSFYFIFSETFIYVANTLGGSVLQSVAFYCAVASFSACFAFALACFVLHCVALYCTAKMRKEGC